MLAQIALASRPQLAIGNSSEPRNQHRPRPSPLSQQITTTRSLEPQCAPCHCSGAAVGEGWRREVADHLVDRLDAEGELRFVGSRPEDRREMLKIAGLLPRRRGCRLYEDPSYPGMTFMDLRLAHEQSRRSPLRMTYPDSRRDEAV